MNLLKLQHRLTFYHFRFNHRSNRASVLFKCSCGWHRYRAHDIKRLARQVFLCSWRSHDWHVELAQVGPVGFKDDDPDVVTWDLKQCNRCYKCVVVNSKES